MLRKVQILFFLSFLTIEAFGSNYSHQFTNDTIEYTIYSSYEEFQKEVLNQDAEQTVVVNFWATWCAPCVKELPYFEELNAGQNDLRIVLVSLDFVEQIEKRFKPFVEKRGLKSELVILDDMDANKWIDLVDLSWSGTIPATMVVKGRSKIFTDKEFESVKEIEEFIQKLNK